MHPLDQIARRLATGELSATEALRLAREPAVTSTIEPQIVEELTATAHNLRLTGRWRHAIRLLKVLLEALDAAGDDAVPSLVRDSAGVVWVESVASALWHAPDPRLYRDALKRGEQVVASARARKDGTTLGRALHALGEVHLGPFSTHRSLAQVSQLHVEWERRLYEGETWDGERAPSSPEGPFPESKEALRLAERYLREAVAVCDGEARAQALNALLAALDVRERLGDPAPRADVGAVGKEALAALTEHGDPARIVEVIGRLQAAGVPVDFQALSGALATPIDQLLERYDAADTVSLLLNGAWIHLTNGAAPLALGLLAAHASLLAAHAHGDLRRNWLRCGREALRDAYRAGFETPAAGVSIKDANAEAETRADAEGWDSERAGAALLVLAEHSRATGEELLGIPMLGRLELIEPFARHVLALHALLGGSGGAPRRASVQTNRIRRSITG